MIDGASATTIIIALIALLSAMVGGSIWVTKYFARTLSKDMKEHTKAAVQLKHAAKEQTKASGEVLTFMQNLNGKLAKATIQTVKEQNVEHQHIEVQK